MLASSEIIFIALTESTCLTIDIVLILNVIDFASHHRYGCFIVFWCRNSSPLKYIYKQVARQGMWLLKQEREID